MNQYALGYKLLKNSRKVKADTIRTAFLFGLEHEMQVELFKLDKDDEIDTLELCIAAAWELSRWLELEQVGGRAEWGGAY